MSVQSSQITADERDGVTIIHLHGEVDYLSLSELTRVLQCVNKSDKVIVSLADSTYLDSVVLHAIIQAAGRLRRNRRYMTLVDPVDPTLRRLLEITGVSLRVRSHPSVDAAIAEATSPQGGWDGVEQRAAP